MRFSDAAGGEVLAPCTHPYPRAREDLAMLRHTSCRVVRSHKRWGGKTLLGPGHDQVGRRYYWSRAWISQETERSPHPCPGTAYISQHANGGKERVTLPGSDVYFSGLFLISVWQWRWQEPSETAPNTGLRLYESLELELGNLENESQIDEVWELNYGYKISSRFLFLFWTKKS
jgi:hypothetical protein